MERRRLVGRRTLQRRQRLVVAATATAFFLLAFGSLASAAPPPSGIPGFAAGWPASPAPVYPVASAPIKVTLSPLGAPAPSRGAAAPAAGPVIVCAISLGQYVHYSKPGRDTSWHWTWACDEPVHLTGGHALYVQGYPYVTGGVSNTGASGNENIRYGGCVGAWWWGSAYGTFSAPGYTPGSFEGSSPQTIINCP